MVNLHDFGLFVVGFLFSGYFRSVCFFMIGKLICVCLYALIFPNIVSRGATLMRELLVEKRMEYTPREKRE